MRISFGVLKNKNKELGFLLRIKLPSFGFDGSQIDDGGSGKYDQCDEEYSGRFVLLFHLRDLQAIWSFNLEGARYGNLQRLAGAQHGL